MSASPPASWTLRAPAIERLLSAADVARIDAAATAAGVSGRTLMTRAGSALADRAAKQGPHGPIAVLAGPGNNGGDGYVAAATLWNAGGDVVVYALGDPAALRGDAAQAYAAWSDAGGQTRPLSADTVGAILSANRVIDALFGVGLSRPLLGPAATLAMRLAEARDAGARRPWVLAADIPSGVSADTGAVLGAAIPADVTTTFVAAKPGHLLGDGALLRGELEVVDILQGVDSARDAAQQSARRLIATPWPERLRKNVRGHKYAEGHLLALSGGFGASGAARLAARAALRIGAGLVSVGAPGSAMLECAAQLTSIMLRRIDDGEALRAALQDPRISAIVLGPGLSRPNRSAAQTREMVAAAAASSAALVLDADALTAFEDAPDSLWERLRGATEPVLTPHGGEFARLFPDLADLGKLEATRAAAARAGAIVLYKGFDTVVAAPCGAAVIHCAAGEQAAADLATAGSGDVLAGLIGGLAARGWPGFAAAAAGAQIHAELGRRLGPGLIAEDLPEAVPLVLRALAAD